MSQFYLHTDEFISELYEPCLSVAFQDKAGFHFTNPRVGWKAELTWLADEIPSLTTVTHPTTNQASVG